MIIVEMAAFYKAQGITLWEFINSIYEKYGYFFNQLDNYAFEGASGMQKMADMMDSLRNEPPKEINGSKVVWVGDYKTGVTTDGETGLPKSNVLSYRMESGDAVIVRPSGTEPKIKIYITAKAKSREEAEEKLVIISGCVKELLGIE
jgi:phosphoglucomutase